MQKLYFFLLLTIFSLTEINSQSCPDRAFSSSSKIYFIDDDSTIVCANMPANVIIGGSNYILDSCSSDGDLLVYSTIETPILDNTAFTVDFGGSIGSCNYEADGLLPIEKAKILNKTILYPNPVKTKEKLNIGFAAPVSGKISVFDIAGKNILNDFVANSKSKIIDVSSLLRGVYILKVESKTLSISKKIVVIN